MFGSFLLLKPTARPARFVGTTIPAAASQVQKEPCGDLWDRDPWFPSLPLRSRHPFPT